MKTPSLFPTVACLSPAVMGMLAGAANAQSYMPAVGCEVSDFSMAMSLHMPLSPDGSGAPGAQAMQGTLEIRHPKIPKDKSRWSLDGRKPAMFWNRGGDLKMLILLGTGEEMISIVIETSNRQGGGEHSGSFKLETRDVKLTGRLACAVG